MERFIEGSPNLVQALCGRLPEPPLRRLGGWEEQTQQRLLWVPTHSCRAEGLGVPGRDSRVHLVWGGSGGARIRRPDAGLGRREGGGSSCRWGDAGPAVRSADRRAQAPSDGGVRVSKLYVPAYCISK